jgi:hypothetical protein
VAAAAVAASLRVMMTLAATATAKQERAVRTRKAAIKQQGGAREGVRVGLRQQQETLALLEWLPLATAAPAAAVGQGSLRAA